MRSARPAPFSPAEARLRPWRAEDRPLGEALFDSNTPRFFAALEKADFLAFVDDPPGPYFVLESPAGEALGCGGYARQPAAPSVAALCWGMVRGDLHGQGLGRRLLVERLDLIAAEPTLEAVEIETTQHSRGFFARHGFVETAHAPDGFAPGMDRVDMTLRLEACRRG